MLFSPSVSMQKTNLVRIKFFIFIAFFSGMLIKCVNTEGTLKIKGKVLDESTKEGIPGKNIIIHASVNISNKSEQTEVSQFSTDSSGCFSLTFRKVKNDRYYKFSFVGDSNYVFITRTLGLRELEQNAKYLIFSLDKLVDLTIKLKRKSETPARDTLRLIWESNGFYGLSLYPYKIHNYGSTNNSFELASDRDLMWVGGNVNSAITTKVFADKKTELMWELFRNGKRQIFIDTMTCKRNFTNIVYFTY